MQYNFDIQIDRNHTNTIKYNFRKKLFGNEKVIPLWVADMDLPVCNEITIALKKRIEHPLFGYTLQSDNFYNSFIKWMNIRHNIHIKEEWLCFSPAVVPSLSMLISIFATKFNKVAINTPVYHPFYQIIKDNGCAIVESPLIIDSNGNYQIDFKNLEDCFKQGIDIFLLCNPHNPVGKIFSNEDLDKILHLAETHNVLVISDEIHCDIILDNSKKHVSLMQKNNFKNIISCFSPGKTFNLAGMAASVVSIPDIKFRSKFKRELERLHLFSGNLLGYTAFEAAYESGMEWHQQSLQYLKGNRDFAIDYLTQYTPKIKPNKPDSTFLLWLDCTDMPFENENQLKHFFYQKAEVGLSHGKIFGKNYGMFMRLNFATQRSLLVKALEQIRQSYIEL
ncbi:MalY/PatB family protein [Aureibacter tunicatorum]|uniref:cysteine-S-conjugate beta-lyase n=1 Tax=Aureibacter tunicatorum TaxID=866807 RepID=A0AAE3XQY4_9BACT|nr:MalY/PatB family protein [Aureibacter tunicatorum]MDR6239794.1 cystathionine beta-lyase [Aureibacter tunicatorum]BDD04269.1 aminotransferase [Aureibacter tunicatorum]